MALTLSELEAFRDALIRARASSSLEVEYQDAGVQRRVRYRNDADLAAALADVERRIADLEGNGLPRHVIVRASKGY